MEHLSGADEAVDRSPVEAYLRTPMPEPATPWRQAGLCVLDLETTGLDPPDDEIIAFATMPIDGGRARVRGTRSRLVRPRRMPGPDSIRIHGLRSEDLVGAPPLSEVLDELLWRSPAGLLVAHVASLEERFLRGALPAGISFRNPVIDTHALAAELSLAAAITGSDTRSGSRAWRASSGSRCTAPTTPPATCLPPRRCSWLWRPSSTRSSRRRSAR